MSRQVSSGLTMSHQVSSGLTMSQNVSPCLTKSPHVSSCLNVSHVILSHRTSSALGPSHPFNRIPSHRIISIHIILINFVASLIISYIISRHFPQSPPFFNLQASEKPWKTMKYHCIAFVHTSGPQVPRSSFTLQHFGQYSSNIMEYQVFWHRMLWSRWAGNPGFTAAEITAAFLKMQMTEAPIMVLFLNMDEAQWNHPIQTSFLRLVWYCVVIVLLVVNLCAWCCLALRVNLASDSSESVRTVLG